MINLIHYSKDFSSRFGKSWKGSRSRAFRLTYSDRVPAFGANAKAGVDLLTQSTAMQYGKSGIRCNCVRPGLIVTPENGAYVSGKIVKKYLQYELAYANIISLANANLMSNTSISPT